MTSSGGQALRLTVVSAAARAPAFLIPVLIASVRGASRETDGYFIAYGAVLLVAGTVAQAIEQSIVPFAVSALARAPANGLQTLDRVAVQAGAVTGFLWMLANGLVPLVIARDLVRSVSLCMVSLTPLALLWPSSAVYSGALVSQWRIAAATGSMALRGGGALLGVAVTAIGGGLWAVGLGLGIGELARLTWLRRGFRNVDGAAAFGNGVPLEGFRKAAVAQSAAGAATGALPLVERLLAVQLGVGAASHLEYASRLLILPTIVFDGGIGPMLLARWSQSVASGKSVGNSNVVRPVLKGLALAVCCAVLTAILAPLLVGVLLAHGKFSDADAFLVTDLLRWLALGFVATMGALMLERLFLAQERNKLLAFLSVGRAGLRLATVVVLLPAFGLRAFAIGLAVAEWSYLGMLAATTDAHAGNLMRKSDGTR